METDPRNLGGDILGGDAFGYGTTTIDTRNAVLMDEMTVSTMIPVRDGVPEPGNPSIALVMEGRINKTEDRAKVLFLFDVDGAAAIISELTALARRQGGEFEKALTERTFTLMNEEDKHYS